MDALKSIRDAGTVIIADTADFRRKFYATRHVHH